MKTTEQPEVTNTPKEQGNQSEGNNPKKPGNDPDQTPEKEIEEPPRANPGTKEPEKTPQQKPGFETPKAK